MLQSCVSLPINRNYNAFNRKHNVVTDIILELIVLSVGLAKFPH